jgi:hypothetical protein
MPPDRSIAQRRAELALEEDGGVLHITLVIVLVLIVGLAAAGWAAEGHAAAANPYVAWPASFPPEAGFFPIAVWMQSPDNAEAYAALGINTYVAIAGRLDDEATAKFAKAGIRVVVGQRRRGAPPIENTTIAAWMHGDEPDNAQPAEGGGWGPAIPPARIIANYEAIKAKDPSRPVLLNLGQQVANDEWYGRGCEITDYPEYVKACDIVSFDVYPVVGIDKPDGEDYLWYVAKGLDRLQRWTGGGKIIWNCIECTHIGNAQKKATPAQVKAEVWMSLIHGSRGLIYFVHQFEPGFVEAGLLADPEMSAAVREINRQISELAPVLNSPTIPDGAVVTTSNPLVPIDLMAKQHHGATYILAVGMRNAEANGRFRIPALPEGKVEVLGEDRTLDVHEHEFRDAFAPYAVHLYKVTPVAAPGQ